MSAKRLMSAVMVALLVGAVTYFAVAWITGSATRETAAGDDARPERPTLVPEGLTPGPTSELKYPTDWNHEVSDALATEAAKPRFDGDLAGIHIDGNADHQRPWFQCPEAEEYVFDIGAAGGTAYDILSEGLPEGVS